MEYLIIFLVGIIFSLSLKPLNETLIIVCYKSFFYNFIVYLISRNINQYANFLTR